MEYANENLSSLTREFELRGCKMTRINLVCPSELTDKHLMAEYRELPRIFTYVNKHGVPNDIPERYTLGKGHVKFFCDKLDWLYSRYRSIFCELINRGFAIDKRAYSSVRDSAWVMLGYESRYRPTPEELYLNMARLCKRCKVDNVKKELSSND